MEKRPGTRRFFSTSKPNISMHISNILEERELDEISVVKDFLTTAADGKDYNVRYYALPMILAVGFRVRSIRGTQFRQWVAMSGRFPATWRRGRRLP